MRSYLITVTGLVQGVGFRPFVYRIAADNKIMGWVTNRTDSVLINAQGSESALKIFLDQLRNNPPVLSKIDSVSVSEIEDEPYSEFSIKKSEDNSDTTSEISPDIAVCEDCLLDMKKQQNRIDYPFINCTNCGPRFSIIKDFPYDRDKTTMKPFPMCESCRSEYENILDRRFHAQPVACADCGPSMQMIIGKERIDALDEIYNRTVSMLEGGSCIVIKGMGGFQLVCNALDNDAVRRMRDLKQRDGKPFAVMFRNIESVKEYAFVSGPEEEALLSYRRPVVILKKKKDLAEGVSLRLDTIGCILPYMPFHYTLFERLSVSSLVFTSGNLSGEPIVIHNEEAVGKLLPVFDALILYNREIYNRTDDSVVRIVNNEERIMRRSRGYVPAPLKLDLNISGILAAGPELKNTFAVGLSKRAVVSQHIGDLENLETYNFYCETIERYKKIFRFNPEMVVRDLHPDYLSSRYADETGLPVVSAQHHHAHCASVMAEYGLNEKVIGIAMDGTGLGDDGKIWGSEFLLCDLSEYSRYTHLDYIPVPGGDKAAKEPWRMALSYIYRVYGRKLFDQNITFLKKLDTGKIELILSAIDSFVNTPLSSSMGRLFDSVSALAGLCSVNTFEAEGPIRLESVIDRTVTEHYPYDYKDTIHVDNLIRGVVDDIEAGVPVSTVSARFHNSVIDMIVATAMRMRKDTSVGKVVLSGGIFQNRYLLTKTEELLEEKGFKVYVPSKVPVNDGGISLGQLAIGAERRLKGCV